MSPRKLAMRDLAEAGYTLKRAGASHDIYYNAETGTIIPLKRHDFNDNDRKYIQREIKQAERKRG